MVDSGCFKTKLKKEKRRTDDDHTREETEEQTEKKYGRLYSFKNRNLL